MYVSKVKSYNPKQPKGRMYTPTELKGHRVLTSVLGADYMHTKEGWIHGC